MHTTTKASRCAFAVLAGLLAAGAATASTKIEGTLPRRAELGFSTTEHDGRLVVRKVGEGSPAARAGLREGDEVLEIDGRRIGEPYVGEDLLRRLDGGRSGVLGVSRGGRELALQLTPPARAVESFAGTEAVYGELVTPDGARLRTILTRPEGARAPLPALFVTQWVSCDTIEVDDSEAIGRVLRALVERSGMVVVRVERASGGDSEGPGCHQLDYDTEVAHYRFAYERLVAPPWIDPARVVVLGSSLGSTTAPLVAAGHPVAGMIVSGGGALTYLERMVAFDRLALERAGDPRRVHTAMLRHVAFLEAYLLDGDDPERIARERPELAGVWAEMRGTGDGVHYGRPYAWHRQAAARDFLTAWAGIEAPALVLYAEYDQFEPSHGHRLIVETLNRLRPGSATYVELPRMGHDWAVYPSPEAALRWERGVGAPELVAAPILDWLRARGLAPTAPPPPAEAGGAGRG